MGASIGAPHRVACVSRARTMASRVEGLLLALFAPGKRGVAGPISRIGDEVIESRHVSQATQITAYARSRCRSCSRLDRNSWLCSQLRSEASEFSLSKAVSNGCHFDHSCRSSLLSMATATISTVFCPSLTCVGLICFNFERPATIAQDGVVGSFLRWAASLRHRSNPSGLLALTLALGCLVVKFAPCLVCVDNGTAGLFVAVEGKKETASETV